MLHQGDEALDRRWLVEHGNRRASDAKLKRDSTDGDGASLEEGLSLLERGERSRGAGVVVEDGQVRAAAIVQVLASTAVPRFRWSMQ